MKEKETEKKKKVPDLSEEIPKLKIEEEEEEPAEKGFNEEHCRQFYRFLGHEESWTEIRAFRSDPGKNDPRIKFVDNEDDFVEFCKRYSGERDIYAGVNPRKGEKESGGGSYHDVEEIRWIPFDIDAVRAEGYRAEDKPKNVPADPASEEELQRAIACTESIKDEIVGMGLPEPAMDVSGNGCHLITPIEPINPSEHDRDELEERLNKFQRIAIDELEVEDVSMDPIGDPARIIRVAGTQNLKGKESENRKHRMARPHSIPDLLVPSSKLREKILSLKVEEEEEEEVSTERVFRNKYGWRLKDILQETDDDKLKLLLNEINPSEFDYPSPSEADMAAMQKLLYWEFDDPTIIDIMKVFRHRDKLEREGYVKRTLKKAKKNQDDYISDYQNPRTWNPIEGSTSSSSDQSKLDQLIELGLNNTEELFLDERDKPCATIEGGGHLEIRELESKYFKQYLGKLLYENEGKGITSDSLNSAVNTLCAHARFAHDVEHRELHNRIARHNGAIFYDLCDDKWRAVKVSEKGWDIEDDVPPLFRRVGTMGKQMEPSEDGTLEDLLDFLNIKKGDDELLFKVYLVSCFVPDIPHPIIMFIGPHGSAKSDTMRFAKLLVDPSEPLLLDFQYNKTETILQLFWHYMPIYDNLSKMKEWFSNLLCRACTGQGFMKRQLYTDEEPMIYNYRRCVGFNGISISPSKPDLQDRLITFKLPRIDETGRKREEELLEEFDDAKPGILGSIFSILSKAMKIRDQVSLDRLPRMADFAEWGEAIARAMGYEENEFIRAYEEKKGTQRRETLEENPVGLAVLKLMEETNTWAGTPTDLLDRLNKIAEEEKIDTDQDKWPGNATWITRRAKEIETDLNREGIDTDLEGSKDNRRWIALEKTEGQKRLADTKNTKNTKSGTSSLGEGGRFINKEKGEDESKGNENSVSSVNSVSEEEIPELDLSGDRTQEDKGEDSTPKSPLFGQQEKEEKSLGEVEELGTTEEEEEERLEFPNADEVEIPCDGCKNMGIEREAKRKVSRNGRDMWLCEKCLQEMGYEVE